MKLYRIYDGAELLYVGITGDIQRRLREHATWMAGIQNPRVVETDVYDDEAAEVERAVILAERPRLNKAWRAMRRSHPLSVLKAMHPWLDDFVAEGRSGLPQASWRQLADVLRTDHDIDVSYEALRRAYTAVNHARRAERNRLGRAAA